MRHAVETYALVVFILLSAINPVTGEAQIVDESSVSSSKVTLSIGAFIGLAFPTWYNPQMFNHAGVSLGTKVLGEFLTSIDLRIAATSAAIRDTFPNAVKILDRSIGISVMWFGLPDLFVSLSPALERRSYWLSIPLGDPREQFLESENRFSIGLGAGVRLNELVVFELRHYPVIAPRLFPQSESSEQSRTELRAGFLLDFDV